MSSILELKDVSFGYNGIPVISALSLDINKGDYLCILGENGAGKSTLMKGILGLIKPISGEILFKDGLNKRDIGYLTQQSQVQRDFPASVTEIIFQGCQNQMGWRPFYSKKEKTLVADAIKKMNIENLAKKCYRELSGGQQQRVLLARALCSTQKILFLDEPVTGLDPSVVTEFYAIIEKLNREDGVTIIMISHDVKASIKHASHVLFIGEKNFFGTKDQYLASDQDIKFVDNSEGK